MQSNSSSSGPLTSLSVCGGEEDEREISKLVSPTGSASNLAAFNLSLNCWLHILSKESSLDLHGDSANLAVGLFKDFSQSHMSKINKCKYKKGNCMKCLSTCCGKVLTGVFILSCLYFDHLAGPRWILFTRKH